MTLQPFPSDGGRPRPSTSGFTVAGSAFTPCQAQWTAAENCPPTCPTAVPIQPLRGPWSALLSASQRADAAAFIDQEVHQEPGQVTLTGEHPLAPHLVYVLADRGRTEEALMLATSLKDINLRTLDTTGDPREVLRVADVIAARLWLATLTHVADATAVAAALATLAGDHLVDPRRRTVLRLFMGVTLMGALGVGEAELMEAREHLEAARSEAALLGYVSLEVATLSALALLHVPSGDPEAARQLATAALSRAEAAAGTPRPATSYWRFVANAVDQWACYVQARPTNPCVLADLERSLSAFSFDAVTSVVAGTVVALGHAQSGAMPQARSLFHSLLSDHRFDSRGVWRLFPLVGDAYLAIASGDQLRTQERESDLLRAGAPGEQLLIRAVRLAGTGNTGAALTALQGVTSRHVRSTGLTFPVACALEAILLEQSGQHVGADRSIRQALGAAEPYGAGRVLAAHDPQVMIPLVRRAAAARPADRWTHDILAYLEREVARTDPPQRIEVSAPATSDAAAELDQEPSPATSKVAAVTPALMSPLTARESQVLALISQGASQGQVARQLYVSLNTVKTHLRSIRHKLGAERTGEAAALARSAGWLAP